MSISDDRTAHWLAKMDVSEVVLRHFMAMDDSDWSTVRECIASEITLDVGSLGRDPAVGRDEYMKRLIERNVGYDLTIHMNPGHIVDIDGDEARLRSHLLGAHGVGDRDAENFWGFGLYDIGLIREAGAWKITRISVNLLKTFGGEPASIMQAAAKRYAGSTTTAIPHRDQHDRLPK